MWILWYWSAGIFGASCLVSGQHVIAGAFLVLAAIAATIFWMLRGVYRTVKSAVCRQRGKKQRIWQKIALQHAAAEAGRSVDPRRNGGS